VPVCHDYFRGPSVKGPSYGGIDVCGHELAKARILGVFGIDVIPMDDTRYPLHVGCDKDLHDLTPPLVF
jgi:hypothetical protein